jgi:hypothetical protein
MSHSPAAPLVFTPLEFSTDLDEMGIFVLSKDQTFRICATFLDPAKFSILAIHLIQDSFSDTNFRTPSGFLECLQGSVSIGKN